jgi:predicted DNA-binding transcriptional regulator YafY
MLKDLERYLKTGVPVDIIYMDRNEQFTKRTVRLKEISGEYVKAYCYTRHATRVFKIQNILAVQTSIRLKSPA